MKNNCFLILFVFLILLSCQNEEKWYPSTDVTIASQYEYNDPSTLKKQIFVTCVVHNTSNTTINSGAVTFQVKTDKREYLQTIAINTRIIPSGKIAVNAVIAYLDNTEQVKPNGVIIYSSYFD